MIDYTLIEEPNKIDTHRFKLRDGSATIEVVQTNYKTYYNVFISGKKPVRDLSHYDFIINYYQMNDGSDFGILVYRAQDMYLQLTDETF